MNRISRDDYGLTVARAVAARADCTRRQVGAVVMDDEGRIVSTGYNGAPAGEPGCASAGACPRGRLSYDEHPHGVAYEAGESRCIAVHAEANAIVYAGRERTKGCTIYVTDEPCYLCALIIKAAGITRVVVAPQVVHEGVEGLTAHLDRLDAEPVLPAPFPVHRVPGHVTSAADAAWLTPERRAAWERLQETVKDGDELVDP